MTCPRARSWSTGLAVVVAAVASIATSQPSWSVGASLAPQSSPPEGQAFVYSVDSNQTATAHVGPNDQPVVVGPSGTTPSSLIVFHGQALEDVSIGGGCSGGCSCDPPDGAFVRVSGASVVPAWSISDTRQAPNPGAASIGSITVSFDRSGLAPVRFSVAECPIQDLIVNASNDSAQLFVSSCEVPTVTVSVTIDGICNAQPCPPPAGAAIKILSVTVSP